MNIYQSRDVEEFVGLFTLSSLLKGSTFLVTGGTGLIGSTLVHCLLGLNKGIKIILPVRNAIKAQVMFGSNDCLEIIECDLLEWLKCDDSSYDYIVHCACPTAGKFMVEHPVETYELTIESTRLLLKNAKKNGAKGMVFVSSLEYYGQVLEDFEILESHLGYVDPLNLRSCYPLGKRAAEYLCFAYANEYNVPIKVARLTQTFGAGVSPDDNRVFAQFARSVIAGNDIVMHTTGESAKPYCYTTDCISAILYILLKGGRGEAYNVANSSTYISIKALAEFLKENFNPSINVVVEEHPEMGYAPVTKLRLSTKKLEALGWTPQNDLKKMFSKLIDSFK